MDIKNKLEEKKHKIIEIWNYLMSMLINPLTNKIKFYSI